MELCERGKQDEVVMHLLACLQSSVPTLPQSYGICKCIIDYAVREKSVLFSLGETSGLRILETAKTPSQKLSHDRISTYCITTLFDSTELQSTSIPGAVFVAILGKFVLLQENDTVLSPHSLVWIQALLEMAQNLGPAILQQVDHIMDCLLLILQIE